MSPTASRFLVIGCLILAGESAFSLPFHVARFFRPTTLEVFGFSNAQLGDVIASYGAAAMLAYFPGGPIADRFSPRKLMAGSLVATGLGGFYMASIPGMTGMMLLFAYWGITSILFFWAAMVRATREWGGSSSQGTAFGVLEGGRGLLAAALANLAVVVFALFFPDQAEAVSAGERRAALRAVIHFYSAETILAGLCCWLLIPESGGDRALAHPNPLKSMGHVLRTPSVWVQALIVVCAYCGYKGLDNYSLYAAQVLGMSEVDAARFTARAAWIRPVSAVAAGYLADRLSARSVIGGLFATMALSYGLLARSSPAPELLNIVYANIFISFFGVYGLRGVYFALLQETRVPSERTGTAVGLISVVGFTPEVFYAPIAGRLLDHAPGLAGHQHNFMLLTGIALVGVIAATVLLSRAREHAARADR